jgi:UDP-arabinose 4-epimerase
MTTILVTGGAGYIGSHACKALAAAGYTPVTFDNLARGHRDAVRWGPFVQGDILDRPALDDVLRQYRPAAVMHFAAFAYVAESASNPGRYYRNNVAGSLTLLEAMRHAGVYELVFSSTCATYGLPRTPLIAEDHPQEPINPYGASKLMVERMLRDFDAAHGLRSIALRYFNAAGADPAGEIGEDHEPEPHLVPLALDAALGRLPALTIHGDRHATPDGTGVRDYVHVSDLAEAHVLALKALQAGCASSAFNLGNGQGFSVREVIDAVQAVTGRPIQVRVGPPRAGDPPTLVADASRARAQLGWQPRITRLDEIVATAWQWHQRRRSHRP